MKNLSLLLAFFCLLGIAYYIEEVYKKKESETREDLKREKTSLFKNLPLNFTELKTKNYNLKLENDKWQVANLNYPASTHLVSELRKIFLGIETVGVLQLKDHSQVFSKTNIPFTLKVGDNEYHYRLGDFSSVTGRFYVEVNKGEDKVIYLCQDKSLLNLAYKNEEELNIKKYVRLRNILQGQKDLLIDRALFATVPIDKIQTLSIDNKRNRKFQVQLHEPSTVPVVLKGLNYRNPSTVLNMAFQQLRVKSLLNTHKNILSHLASTVHIFHDERKTTLKLYKGHNEVYGYFVVIEGIDHVFEIDESASKLFYLNVQDFWDKRILDPDSYKGKKRVDFSMKVGELKRMNFQIESLENFEVTTKEANILALNNNYINFVFNLIFNLTEFRQANYVDKFEDMPNNGNCLRVDIFKRKLDVCLDTSEIAVYNHHNMIKYVFLYSTKALGLTDWNDLFTLKAK